MSDKAYLGDSVYVEVEHGMLKLTTENGDGPSNTIFLEPEVYDALTQYMARRIRGGREPNTISDDTLSPHYGHRVVDLDADGRWHCETCDGPLKPIDGDCYDDVRAAATEDDQ